MLKQQRYCSPIYCSKYTKLCGYCASNYRVFKLFLYAIYTSSRRTRAPQFRRRPVMTHFVVSMSAGSMGNCGELARMMQQMGYAGDITPNQTVLESGTIEPGCRILFLESTIDQVGQFFQAARRQHSDLGCAHVRSFHNETEGCVLNLIDRISKCPQASRRSTFRKCGSDNDKTQTSIPATKAQSCFTTV